MGKTQTEIPVEILPKYIALSLVLGAIGATTGITALVLILQGGA